MAWLNRTEALKRQVRNALGRLYDPIYLRRHPLVAEMVAVGLDAATPCAAGAALRDALLQAIETIKPDTGRDGSECIWRPYRIMQLRYVEAMTPTQVQSALGVAKTQYYRQHEQALDAVTEAFAAAHLESPASLPEAPAQEMPHLWVLPPMAPGHDTSERHVYLVPMASLADVKRALAAIQEPGRDREPVVFVVDRLERSMPQGE